MPEKNQNYVALIDDLVALRILTPAAIRRQVMKVRTELA
jgi:hypothetical protein